MYAGHLSSDPGAGTTEPTDVTPHLFFFMVKARRTADKERIIFWLNVGPLMVRGYRRVSDEVLSGRSRVFFF